MCLFAAFARDPQKRDCRRGQAPPAEQRKRGGGTRSGGENTRAMALRNRASEVANPSAQPRHADMHSAFGNDAFGRLAEKAARFFGTPQYIVGQTIAVLTWVLLNATQLHLGFAWD